MAKEKGRKLVAQNRKARHDYHIHDTYEAGIVLSGTEVKSLREGRANLTDAFATVDAAAVLVKHGGPLARQVASRPENAARWARLVIDSMTGQAGPRRRGDAAFVGERQVFVGAVEAEPLRVDGFVVRVLLDADLASDGFEQVVVHHLVDAVAGHGEPVVDDAERHEGAALDAGLLLHLAFRGLDERLTGFDVALR